MKMANNYRVYLKWIDGEASVVWVDAYSAEHACFLVGVNFGAPADTIVEVRAMLETN